MLIVESNVSLLYNIRSTSKTNFDCFYAYIVDNLYRTNHLTPYCLRPSSQDSLEEYSSGYVENVISFKNLRSEQIRSDDLFRWSITVDIIEEYEIYLLNNDKEFDDYMFYNCSSPWFGSHCQYTFDSNTSIESFGEFLVSSFNHRKEFHHKLRINTCYPYLTGCYRGPEPMCLDWREICNGIIDCIGDRFGIDEEYCEELEMNECEEDEYRCHNGAQCIPYEFFRDGWTSKDCLDGTDEDETTKSHQIIVHSLIQLDCIGMSTFACEERSCRYPLAFPCGDGDCRSHGLVDHYIHPNGLLCPGTSRDTLYLRAIDTTINHLSSDCQKLLFCKLRFYLSSKIGKYDIEECLSNEWVSSRNCSMHYIPFPADPIFNGYFQVIYLSKTWFNESSRDGPPDYICNDPRQCLYLPGPTFQIGDLDCRRFEQVVETSVIKDLYDLHSALASPALSCSLMGNRNAYRSNISLFHCESSRRSISKHRLVDGFRDCHHGEDEDYPHSCSLNDSHRYRCQSEDKCLSPIGFGLAAPDCIGEEDTVLFDLRPFVFPLLCNRIPEYANDEGEDDESNCPLWPCENPYTRCDNIFHCANGIDELNCPNSKCDVDEFKCLMIESSDYRCISQAYIYEKPINCSQNDTDGNICRRSFYFTNLTHDKSEYLSWKENTCLTDDAICAQQAVNNYSLVCSFVSTVEPFGCPRLVFNIDDNNEPICALKEQWIYPPPIRYFSSFNLGNFPSTINTTATRSGKQLAKKETTKTDFINVSVASIEYCNRGLVIYEDKSYQKKCLCPPNYFGDRCQWQNQRVSLTLRIRKLSAAEKSHSIYEILIYLIGNESQTIHSYEKIMYIPSIDCETKYNRYLLYPTRPKDFNSTYFIHIDMFDKVTLIYYASWYLPILFPFLPVNRLATQILIPYEKLQSLKTCSLKCGVHGKCFYYVNSTRSFCKCNPEYSGRFCNVKHSCSCSSDSICLNSSICLCPVNKFGSKCYLQHASCPSEHNPCKNNGQCIPMDDRINKNDFICSCTEDYMGPSCEYKSNQIDIHFKTNAIPSVVFIHLITAFDNKSHERMTTFKKVPFNQDSITLYLKQSFHILLVEFFNDFYLTVLREQFLPSEYISTDIQNDHMCVNITQLLNSTILQYNYLRRLKYYLIPCMENIRLKCFYDEQHICICDRKRYSSCFNFNPNISYDCQGYNPCQNNGKCFQDNVTCPTTSACMCEKCFYGNKCQFSTKGVSLSLDAIFGYHIKPFVSFFQQSKAVKITASLTIIILVCGLTSGLLSVVTFRSKILTDVGCRIYLLSSSVVSLLTVSMFTIKYWQIVLFQMNTITNRSFLHFNCIVIDVLLKILLSSCDWLNACVAIERAITTIQGVRFCQSKSRYIALRITPVIFIIILISYIHDPISRQLFDDEDEQRVWCIVNYSSTLKTFDRFINLFHFVTSFIINFLSALIIIIQVCRIRSKTKATTSRTVILYAEIKRHRHLLISPCILILLAFPRLLISLLSRCMESARDPWLFLTGYYISFVPSLFIFVVFVLPSEKYKQEFTAIMRKKLRRS